MNGASRTGLPVQSRVAKVAGCCGWFAVFPAGEGIVQLVTACAFCSNELNDDGGGGGDGGDGGRGGDNDDDTYKIF